MKLIMKNKKGDVPITILVIGIFALCSLALFTFFIADIKTSNSFVGINELGKLNIKLNNYEFLKAQGGSLEKIENNLGVVLIDGEKYFVMEKKRTSQFWGKNDLEFYVRYKIPSN